MIVGLAAIVTLFKLPCIICRQKLNGIHNENVGEQFVASSYDLNVIIHAHHMHVKQSMPAKYHQIETNHLRPPPCPVPCAT